MLTKSFKKGFRDGFMSPFNLFISTPIKQPEVASFENAWHDIAKMISDSAMCEANKIERVKESSSRSHEKRLSTKCPK